MDESQLDQAEEDFRDHDAIVAALRQSTAAPLKVYPQREHLAEHIPRLPRWPSGLGVEFDSTCGGGLQAVTVLGGPPGVGKSQWSMACALENALCGACVVYFDAENYVGEVRERMIRWFGGPQVFEREFPGFAPDFHWCAIDHSHNWATMMLYAEKLLRSTHRRLLFVLDSIQSIADEIDPGRGMLTVTAEMYSVMNRMVRASGGRIGFLVLSELNREGGMKGGAGSYRGTMVVRIDHAADELRGEGYKLAMLKNRNGPTPNDLGLWELDWWRCRFRRVQLT